MQSYAPQLHLIAGERPCLVAEDILDLAKFLDERGRAAECGRIRFYVVHVEIRIDELSLLELDNLHGDNEGDRDQVVVQDNERQNVCA